MCVIKARPAFCFFSLFFSFSFFVLPLPSSPFQLSRRSIREPGRRAPRGLPRAACPSCRGRGARPLRPTLRIRLLLLLRVLLRISSGRIPRSKIIGSRVRLSSTAAKAAAGISSSRSSSGRSRISKIGSSKGLSRLVFAVFFLLLLCLVHPNSTAAGISSSSSNGRSRISKIGSNKGTNFVMAFRGFFFSIDFA